MMPSGRLMEIFTRSGENPRTPWLVEKPCRDFGEPGIDMLSSLQAPKELSGYITCLAAKFRDMGRISPAVALHLSELVQKMASAPGYLRYLDRERKSREIVRLFSIVRSLQASGLKDSPDARDLLVSIGILLFNLNPSAKIIAFLCMIRPSPKSAALQYHYDAILALHYLLMGDPGRAWVHATRAAHTCTDADKRAYVLAMLGCIALRKGDYQSALDSLGKAFSLECQDRLKGLIAFYTGVVLFEKGDYARAVTSFEAAGRHAGNPLDRATVHVNIGSCAMQTGDVSRASSEFAATEKLTGDLKGEPGKRFRLVADSYMGAVWRQQGEPEKAAEYYEKALKIAIGSGDSISIAGQLGNLGATFAVSGDYSQALRLLNVSMSLAESADNWAGIRFAYWHTYHVLREINSPDAQRYHDNYTAKYPELGDIA